MYGKLFQSLYQGTMRGEADMILVFSNLLAFKDRDQFVDKHPRCIAEEVGIPEERVRAALERLEAPDPESRTEDHEGKRLLRMDEHRNWGWFIVNGEKYDKIKNEEERREQWRIGQQRHRAGLTVNKSQQASTDVNIGQEMSTPVAVAVPVSNPSDGAVAKAPAKRRVSITMNDEEYIESLKSNPAYKGLDINKVYGKMVAWCNLKGKSPSRARLLGWLNREDGAMTAPAKKRSALGGPSCSIRL